MSFYTGRFAPSPTGPLHFGSLVTAIASYVDAHAHNGHWLVRIEDVDLSRTVAGAAHEILRQLKSFGLEWDGEIVYQSERSGLYEEALRRLDHKVYWCACTRKDSGRCVCSSGLGPDQQGRSIRIRGTEEINDFIIRRADGCWAYQLAVVVDDADQGVTHVVRGEDLLDSTPRQIYLQRLLGYSTPDYFHVPLVADEWGSKLSKQNHADPVPAGDVTAIEAALRFLRHPPPPQVDPLEWAIQHWDRTRLDLIAPVITSTA